MGIYNIPPSLGFMTLPYDMEKMGVDRPDRTYVHIVNH